MQTYCVAFVSTSSTTVLGHPMTHSASHVPPMTELLSIAARKRGKKRPAASLFAHSFSEADARAAEKRSEMGPWAMKKSGRARK
jgi:hypothetical protein